MTRAQYVNVGKVLGSARTDSGDNADVVICLGWIPERARGGLLWSAVEKRGVLSQADLDKDNEGLYVVGPGSHAWALVDIEGFHLAANDLHALVDGGYLKSNCAMHALGLTRPGEPTA